MTVDDIKGYYRSHEPCLKLKLREFAEKGRMTDRRQLFFFLCENLLSPSMNWNDAVRIAAALANSGVLYEGGREVIESALREHGHRFPGKSAQRLIDARCRFYDDMNPRFEIGLESLIFGLRTIRPEDARSRILGANSGVDGLAMKTASHFLRGLGLSNNQLAILDTHVLRTLRCLGVVDEIPEKRPSSREYLRIEAVMKTWADNVLEIPLNAVDLVIWTMKRGNANP